MRILNVLLFESKHFIRSPFKIMAVLLFAVAGVYGLHKGASLFHKQEAEVDKIKQQVTEARQEIVEDNYQKGNLVPENRPWIDYSTPYWAIWYSSQYHFKEPSPAIVYSIGQGEQYGFYKRITFWASPYDADLAEEIANPERLQTGTLDFAFALLFLMPLVLLVLLYNLKSAETEQGFMPLIEVQSPSKDTWLFLRMSFYVLLLLMVIGGLLVYGATLTDVFAESVNAFGSMLLYSSAYLIFWSVLYFFVVRKSKSTLGSTLKMSAVYLLLVFIIPATVHQLLSIRHPTNLMTEVIDVRDQRQELYEQPDNVIQTELSGLFPEIIRSPAHQDSAKRASARNRSISALVNELMKAGIQPIEKENQAKNAFIKSTFWFNPVSFFQNRFNATTQTHFSDYQNYRDEIQGLIDKQIRTMVLDTWNEVKVDQEKYREYYERLVH